MYANLSVMTENQTDFYITLNSTSNHTLNIYFPNQIKCIK